MAEIKEIQEEAKKKDDPLEDLLSRLVQLKLDILDDSSLFQTKEFQELRSQICEVELTGFEVCPGWSGWV